MTTVFQLRATLDEPIISDAILLDWSTTQRGTIQIAGSLPGAVEPPPTVLDLWRFASAVYCADKIARRSEAADGWTRDISLTAAVQDPGSWRSAVAPLTEAISFLTGDRWTFEFVESGEPAAERGSSVFADAVCLFSGGLDSLAGAIDLLEEGRTVCLVGHHEGGLAPGRQHELATELASRFGDDRVILRQLFLRPAPPNALQALPLPPGEREKTTRGRSLLFIATGLAMATAIGDNVPLFVPENGFIGINVPLTAARSGSLSTRTTHPFFIDRLRDALSRLGIGAEIHNPYDLRTKGEVLTGSRNLELLAQLAPRSISCSHPEAGRYFELLQGNCGYCYPCIIRRASLHRAGLDSPLGYAMDVLQMDGFIDADSDRADAVRAVVRSLCRRHRWNDVVRNGPIPAENRAAFDGVYRRGRQEVFDWLSTALDRRLTSLLPTQLL